MDIARFNVDRGPHQHALKRTGDVRRGCNTLVAPYADAKKNFMLNDLGDSADLVAEVESKQRSLAGSSNEESSATSDAASAPVTEQQVEGIRARSRLHRDIIDAFVNCPQRETGVESDFQVSRGYPRKARDGVHAGRVFLAHVRLGRLSSSCASHIGRELGAKAEPHQALHVRIRKDTDAYPGAPLDERGARFR